MREQLSWIRHQLFDLTWRDFIHETFKEKVSKADKRRRDLALAMDFESLPIAKIPEISPRIAAAYAGKTKKTLVRDLGILKRMRLIEENEKGLRAKRELVFAFLPGKAVKPTNA